MGLKLLAGLSMLLMAAHAQAMSSNAAKIERQCISNRQEEDKTRLGLALDNVVDEFATYEARVSDPHKFIRALDRVLDISPFAYLLDCRDRLMRDPKFSYAVKFVDPASEAQEMSVHPVYTNNSLTGELIKTEVTLSFNLRLSVQSALLAYIHELTHVCQTPKRALIYSGQTPLLYKLSAEQTAALDSGSHELWGTWGEHIHGILKQADVRRGNFIRYLFVMEVEAHDTTRRAYAGLVNESRKLCDELGSKPDEPTLFQGYLLLESVFAHGISAQNVVHSYLENFDPTGRYVLIPKSKESVYSIPELPGRHFSLRKFDLRFKGEMEKLGIPITE